MSGPAAFWPWALLGVALLVNELAIRLWSAGAKAAAEARRQAIVNRAKGESA